MIKLTEILLEQTYFQSIMNAIYPTIIGDDIISFDMGCSSKSEGKYKNLKTLYDTLVKKDIINDGDTIVQIRGSKQQLYITSDGVQTETYKISTGAKGFSNKKDSSKTPIGLCYIEKVITTSDKYEVIIGGSETDTILGPNKPGGRKNHCAEVTTGALTLTGAEPCNKNMRNRHIYIHGTNREKYLGQKASGGCIRISNDDILKLTQLLSRGTYVYITQY